jgi:ABC-type oligopeptide transport system substrate-binding subunit
MLGHHWCFRSLGFGLLAVLLSVAGLQGQAPQPPAKPEPGKQVPKKPRVEEEEEPGKQGSKVPVRLEGGPTRSELPTGLLEEADKATHPAAQALFRRLAVPHDEVLDGRTDVWIAPLANCLGSNPLPSVLVVARIDEKGRFTEEKRYPAGQRVVHYEQLALDQVAAFKAAIEKKGPALSRLELAQHAEKVFAAVLRFHEGALEQRVRRGAGWADLADKLRRALLEARLDQFHALADSGKWLAASAFANELVRQYPVNATVRTAISDRELKHARELLQAGRVDGYVESRQILERLERLFPDAQTDPPTERAIKGLRQQLQEKAKGLVKEAEKAAGKDKNLARQQVVLAESIWPQLPELRRVRQELRLDSVLYVRVRSLPTYLSPDSASTDAERLALDLLFESLVRPVTDPAAGQTYETVLAAGHPRLLALGREFHLVRDARWYREGRGPDEPTIDEPVTATDARAGMRRFPELVGQRIDDDPLVLRLRLQQGYLDPLSLMTFKILPKYAADPDFARRPVGSGPYMYLGEETRRVGQGSVPCAVFRANPTYGARAGKTGQPFIREICFCTGKDDLRRELESPEPRPHLALDLQTRQIEELTNPKSGVRGVQVYTLPSRRVYFLAVNHRRPELHNPDLRRAIALAIDRERILDASFRAPVDSLKKPHRVANGPYLPGSWACDKSVPVDLFDRAQASVRAKLAKRPSGSLELKYPADVPEVADACKQIKEQVLQHAGIDISLRPCSAPQLRKAVMDEHDYQLAYWHWDHADDTYWLWPLFDPNATGPGGTNFLGPLKDPALENLFRKAMQYREFSEVQRLTRMIHRQLCDFMPLVPLWQLDAHFAVDQRLKVTPTPDRLDPLHLFGHAGLWKLEN